MSSPNQNHHILPPTPIGGVISIEQATTETKRWRDHQQTISGGSIGLVKAFYIPTWDLQCLLEYYKMFQPTGVRAYIGMREPDDTGCSQLHLLLVPATVDEDFWNKGTIPDGGEVGSSIYDFTAPCPDTCASDNPLNND
jgi:hypothetical protein